MAWHGAPSLAAGQVGGHDGGLDWELWTGGGRKIGDLGRGMRR
jgi:hypothetical protein